MNTKIYAPFTPEQCDALNAFQHDGAMHPFTCGASATHPTQSNTLGPPPGAPPPPRATPLVAWPDGWACPATGCTYHQGWAHAFMAGPVAPAGAWYPKVNA